MGKVLKIQPRSFYDDEKNWTAAGIWRAPSFDVENYQKKLDRIVGVSASGHSICRLSWAWDQRKWQNTKWDIHGFATEGEWRQKYKVLTVEIGDDSYVDIAPPRWVLEERFEPGQYENSWEVSRYRKKIAPPSLVCGYCKILDWIDPFRSDGVCAVCKNCGRTTVLNYVKEDVWGAAPREGWYNLLPEIGIVAQHERNKRCCNRMWEQSREICYGKYKIPSDLELNILRKAISARNRDREANPHEELSPEVLAQAQAWGLQMAEERSVSHRSELVDRVRDEVNTHGASIVPDYAIAALKDSGCVVPVHKTIFSY